MVSGKSSVVYRSADIPRVFQPNASRRHRFIRGANPPLKLLIAKMLQQRRKLPPRLHAAAHQHISRNQRRRVPFFGGSSQLLATTDNPRVTRR